MHESDRVLLFYGKIKSSNHLPNDYIEVTYKGFDGLMDAYLILKDNSIEIIRVAGNFKIVGDPKGLKLNDTINNVDFIKLKDSIKNNYNNVYHLSNNLNKEYDWNQENKSRVTRYNITLLR